MTTPVAAYHLPRGIARPSSRARLSTTAHEREETPREAALELPELWPGALTEVADRLRSAGARLRRIPVAERIAIVDRVAARWLTAGYPLRRLAMERVPLITGYPARAVGAALDHLWQALRTPEMQAVVTAEHPGERSERADLALHVLAGNVPGAGVFGIVAALLAGVPSLVKTARREPLIPALVAESFANEDARLGAALAVAPWPGGDAGLDGSAIAAADLVLAYGRAETLVSIAARSPRRLLRFGPRVSVGLIARESVDRHTAAAAAWQIALFDQQGCLSPQILLVEEDEPATTQRFVTALAAELKRLAIALPRAPLSLAETTAIWRHLERARWYAQEGEFLEVHADPEGRFSAICDRRPHVPTSPLNRHVTVVPVPTLAAAGVFLRRIGGCIEAIGYAGPESVLPEVASLGAACAAPRLCPLDRMQQPTFAWRQSGHARLASFFAAAPPAVAEPAAESAA